MRRALSLAPLVVLAGVLGACGGGSEKSAAPSTPAATPTVAASGCRVVEQPKPRGDGGQSAPTQALDSTKHWTATFRTTCGSFTIALAVKDAPKTTASFTSLAKAGFYDGTVFHRIIPGFVIQGGDPTASGTGGPGYTVVEPPPSGTMYSKGIAAMAKGGTEPAGASGSQFFVVSGAGASQLPPDYALLGRVVRGMAVVERIAGVGDPQGSGTPTEIVVLKHVAVSSS